MTGEPAAPFEVHWTAPARRARRRLPEKVAVSVVEFTYGPQAARPEPGRAAAPLRAQRPVQRTPGGDYRVVYRIDHPRHRVLAIGHRADIYRRP